MLYIDEATDEPYGFNMKLWHSIVEGLNVTSEYVKATSFGKLGANGSWSGMVGMTQRGDIDITLSSMSTTFARYKLHNASKKHL